MTSRFFAIGCLFLGAFSGWWFSAAFWAASGPPRFSLGGPTRPEYLFTAYGCVLLSAACAAAKDTSSRRRLLIGVTVGAVLADVFVPRISGVGYHDLDLLFVDPLGVFPPTAPVIGGFLGGVVALFLPEARRCIKWIRDRIPRSTSQESQT